MNGSFSFLKPHCRLQQTHGVVLPLFPFPFTGREYTFRAVFFVCAMSGSEVFVLCLLMMYIYANLLIWSVVGLSVVLVCLRNIWLGESSPCFIAMSKDSEVLCVQL